MEHSFIVTVNWSILFTLETPHWCRGESSDRKEEPAPEKEPCRGKKGHAHAPGLLLPGELAKHAVSEGTKAVTKYTSSK